MIETKIPMDIRVYKTKLIGPFTTRQLLCVTAAVIVDVILYALVFSTLGIGIKFIIYVFMFIDLPILAFTLEPLGIPMEKYITNVLLNNFLAPTKRKAVTKLFVRQDKVLTKKEQRALKKRLAAAGKKNRNYIPYK